MQWTESRHNPNYSRFDAVNNKYDNIAMPPELIIEGFRLRTLQPPIINSKFYPLWFYQEVTG
jgi:hypothetical protein